MQSATRPNPALHIDSCLFVGDLERFEADHQRRDNIASLGGENWDCDDLVYHVVYTIDIFSQIADLLRIWQGFECQLRLRFRAQLTNIFWMRRRKNGTGAIQKTIEPR